MQTVGTRGIYGQQLVESLR